MSAFNSFNKTSARISKNFLQKTLGSALEKEGFCLTPEEQKALIEEISKAHAKDGMQGMAKIGRQLSSPNEKDNSGRTPLIWAALLGKKDLASALIKLGANIDEIDDDPDGLHWTALTYAAYHGQGETVELLLENGADSEHKDSLDRTAADWARQNKHLAIATLTEEWKGRKAAELEADLADYSTGLKQDTDTAPRIQLKPRTLKPKGTNA